MKRTLLTALLIGTLTAPVAMAERGETGIKNTEITTSITNVLEAKGYSVRKIVREGGNFEAYAIKDGAMFEVVLNGAYEIIRIKAK